MKIYNAGNRIMNTYLYRIKDGYVMIDTGYAHSYQKCTSSMNRQGISWDDVKYIFLKLFQWGMQQQIGFVLLLHYENIG